MTWRCWKPCSPRTWRWRPSAGVKVDLRVWQRYSLNATPQDVQSLAGWSAPRLASEAVSEKLHVDLSGAPQTMLATFYAKALDADLPKPILGDRWAKEIVDRIDYDWSKTSITKANSPSVTTRSAHFDNWARQFLAVQPERHRGASRLWSGRPCLPTGSRPRRRVVRRRLSRRHRPASAAIPEPRQLSRHRGFGHRSRLAGGGAPGPADADDRRGSDHVPHADDGVALLRRFVDAFPTGELQFDAFNGWVSSRSG